MIIRQISECGTIYYTEDGEYHRLDGNAVEYTDGTKHWYYRDKYIPVKSQGEFERYIRLLAFI